MQDSDPDTDTGIPHGEGKGIDRQRRRLMALAAAGSLGLAGCIGGGDDPDDTDDDTDANGDDGGDADVDIDPDQEGLTLLGLRSLDDEDPIDSGSVGAVYNHLLEQFEEETGIPVDYDSISIEDYRTQGLTIMGSGSAPDLFESMQGLASMGQFAESGYAMAIQDLVDDWVLESRDATGWTYEDGQMLGVGTGDDVYGVPNQMSGFPLWYSVPVLEDAGIDHEEIRHSRDVTWDEFNDMCEQIRDAGYDPLAMGNRVGGHIPYLVHAAFIKSVDYDDIVAMVRGDNDMRLDDEVFVEAFELIEEWWDNEYINQDTLSLDEDEAESLIFTQDAAFMTDGIWIEYLYFVAADPEEMGPLGEGWDYMWWPYRPDAYPEGRNQIYGHVNGAWSMSPLADERGKSDEAKQFLEFWADVEQEEFRSEHGNLLPAHEGVTDAFFNEVSASMYNTVADPETTQTTIRIDELLPPEVGTDLIETGQELFTGQMSAREVLENVQETWDNLD